VTAEHLDAAPRDGARLDERAPLADLCDRDPLDLEADPRTCARPRPAPQPCGPLCTPWCLITHS
jgi:hypothetical protein